MIHLALDTATRWQGVGLAIDGVVRGVHTRASGRPGHARDLLATVSALARAEGIQLRDIHGIGVGIGPGSFTGVRIGVALAKGLAAANRTPLHPVPSHLAAAAALPSGLLLLWAEDARKHQIYAAGVTSGLDPEVRVPLDAWDPAAFSRAASTALQTEPQVAVRTGSGWDLYADALQPLCVQAEDVRRAVAGPDVRGILALMQAGRTAPVEGRHLDALYVRPSEAELPRSE